MSRHLLLLLAAGALFIACTKSPPSSTPTINPTSTLISCNDVTLDPNRGSILPAFTPAYACELENSANHINFCMVQASPELSYPCSQTESITEIVKGEGEQTILIQHDYQYHAGCWTGTSSFNRSLRVCDKVSGTSTVVAQDVLGDLIPSPDGTQVAFAEAAKGSYRLEPHIFLMGVDGSNLIQLDTLHFPQDQVVGANILGWSEDGEWLEISLWDGHDGGYHAYRLGLDGSGAFELLP